jgi:hypothetical protein
VLYYSTQHFDTMSNSQDSGRREITRLSEFSRSRTPEPAPKRQRTSRGTAKKTSSSIPQYTRLPTLASVGDTSDRSPGTRVTRSAGMVDHAEPASVGDTSDRSSEPLETPDLAAPWTLLGDATPTGVDTGAMPTAMMEQAAWDASVMPILPGMDADATPIAVVSVTGDISVRPIVGTDTRAGTRANDSDRGANSGTVSLRGR